MRPLLPLFLFAASALALCGSGRAPAVAGPADAYEWHQPSAHQFTLFLAGKQVGNWIVAEELYYRMTAPDTWEKEPSEPPIDPPASIVGTGKRKKCGCCKGCACKKGKCGCKDGKRCGDGCKCGAKVIGKGEQPPCACCGDDCQCATKPCDKPGCKCVLASAEALPVPAADVRNFGVNQDRLSDTERSSVNGHETTKAEAIQALTEGVEGPKEPPTVPDDSAKLSLTIAGGTEAQRTKARADLDLPQFAVWKDSVLLQDYDAASPMLKCGFAAAADHPTIYLQLPAGVRIGEELDEKTGQVKPRYSIGGEVLARVEKYEGPQTWESVRKADPNYHPEKDPDPTKPSPQPAPAPNAPGGFSVHPAVWWGLGGLLCFGTFALFALAAVGLLVRWAIRAGRTKPEAA